MAETAGRGAVGAPPRAGGWRYAVAATLRQIAQALRGLDPKGLTADVIAYLRSHDWWFVASSAGKDSQAMLDYLVELADAAGVPRARLVVVHADLGEDVEWPGTLELAREQAEHYGLRFESVRRKQGGLLSLVLRFGHWPRPANRWCTSYLKRDQQGRMITLLSEETRAAAVASGARRRDVHVSILDCVGIRAAESPQRAKRDPFELNKRWSCGFRTVQTWFPIFDRSTAEVWERIHASGVRYHDAYKPDETGACNDRLSCVLCMMGSKGDIRNGARRNPAILDAYADMEDEIGRDFTQRISLRKLRDELRAEGLQLDNRPHL